LRGDRRWGIQCHASVVQEVNKIREVRMQQADKVAKSMINKCDTPVSRNPNFAITK